MAGKLGLLRGRGVAVGEELQTGRAASLAGRLKAFASRRGDLLGLALGYVAWRVFALTVLRTGLNLWPLRIGRDMHLLPFGPLHQHPLRSLWYLHAQPPGYNAVTAVIIHLPRSSWPVLVWTLSVLLGIVACTFAYQAMLDLGVRRWLAMAGVLVAFVLNPGVLELSDYYLYSYWAACMLSASLLCLTRYLDTRRTAWGVGLLGLAAAIVLTDSLFQWPWFLGLLVLLALGAKLPRRGLLIAAAVPALLVLALMAKDALQFHQPTSSSWTGINLSRRVFATADPAEVAAMLRSGGLKPIATTPAFRPLGPKTSNGRFFTGNLERGYAAKLKVPTSTEPVLSVVVKPNLQPNYNNDAYREASAKLMEADLAYITAHPGTYLRGSATALKIWSLPSSDNFLFTGSATFSNAKVLRGYNAWVAKGGLHTPAFDTYAKLYNRTLGLSFHHGRDSSWLDLSGHAQAPRLSQLSWSAVGVTLAALLGLPWLAWRWRRDRRRLLLATYLWATTTMVLLTSTFVEVGENDRFRASLGLLPAVATLLVVNELMDIVAARRARTP